jgi:hypothetical protein
MTTFARFQPGRIPVVGPIAILVVDWSKPRSGTGPLLDPALLDRLSYAHPAALTAVYVPLSLWLLWQARALGAMAVAAYYLAGLFAWSFIEYVVHRLSFHHAPKNRLQVALTYLLHGVHHAYPDDSRRWVMPLTVTLPIAVVLLLLLHATIGEPAPAVLAGFVHGYLAYDLLHYFIHQGRMRSRLGRYLRQYHLTHHFASPDRHFGVSSPLWDFVFRTR